MSEKSIPISILLDMISEKSPSKELKDYVVSVQNEEIKTLESELSDAVSELCHRCEFDYILNKKDRNCSSCRWNKYKEEDFDV